MKIYSTTNAEDYISRESIMYGCLQNYSLMPQNEIFPKREETGVKITTLSRDDISDLEPNINNIFYKGALFEGSYFAKSPIKVSEALMKLFIKKGGKFKKEKVISIKKTETNQINIKTSSGESLHDRVVITSGVWSNDLLKHIGDKVPLEAERAIIWSIRIEEYCKRPISWQERGTYFTYV